MTDYRISKETYELLPPLNGNFGLVLFSWTDFVQAPASLQWLNITSASFRRSERVALLSEAAFLNFL